MQSPAAIRRLRSPMSSSSHHLLLILIINKSKRLCVRRCNEHILQLIDGSMRSVLRSSCRARTFLRLESLRGIYSVLGKYLVPCTLLRILHSTQLYWAGGNRSLADCFAAIVRIRTPLAIYCCSYCNTSSN